MFPFKSRHAKVSYGKQLSDDEVRTTLVTLLQTRAQVIRTLAAAGVAGQYVPSGAPPESFRSGAK